MATSGIARGPLSHVSFHVEDLDAAMVFGTTQMKAGPFFVLDLVEFEFVWGLLGGAEAVFDHTAAFGQYGDIAVELHRVAPEATRRLLAR